MPLSLFVFLCVPRFFPVEWRAFLVAERMPTYGSALFNNAPDRRLIFNARRCQMGFMRPDEWARFALVTDHSATLA